MRYLVMILVAANVAFFFLYPRPPADSGQHSSNPPGVPGSERLILLSERPAVTVSEVEMLPTEESRANELETRIAADLSEYEPAVAVAEVPVDLVLDQDTADVAQVTVAREIAEGEETVSESVEILDADESYPQQGQVVDDVIPVEETGSAEELVQPVAEDPQIAVLEKEADSGDLTATNEEIIVQEVVPEVTHDPVCYSIGPFSLTPEAGAVARQLEDAGYRVIERVDSIREPKDYWVYLSAMPKDEARRVVADLKARGIKDYFVGKQHYISLGIFSRKSQALRRQKQIAGLGYDAVLDRRFRDRSVRWLDIRDEQDTLSASQLWSGIQENYQDVEAKPASCE